MAHLTTAELEAGLDHVRHSPIGVGRLELIVRRPGIGEREVLAEGRIDPELGLVGDTWSVRASRRTDDGSPHPHMQINVMNARAAALVAGTDEPGETWALAGDQLYVDLHLGADELPPWSRLAIGDEAVIEITDQPHRGCPKFTSRFGSDAMRFVNSPAGRALNLRGINARVVAGGTIRVGDAIALTGDRATAAGGRLMDS
jgi:hypothetical protein